MKSIILCMALAIFLLGCGTAPKRQIHSFHFPPGKVLPSIQDTNRFKCIMETVRANTNSTLLINGNLYPPNQALTDSRVWTVVNALNNAGVVAERMYIKEADAHYRSHIPNNQWFTILVVF